MHGASQQLDPYQCIQCLHVPAGKRLYTVGRKNIALCDLWLIYDFFCIVVIGVQWQSIRGGVRAGVATKPTKAEITL